MCVASAHLRNAPHCRALAEQPEVSGPEVWARLALCHRSLNQPEQALNVRLALLLGCSHYCRAAQGGLCRPCSM